MIELLLERIKCVAVEEIFLVTSSFYNMFHFWYYSLYFTGYITFFNTARMLIWLTLEV